MSAPAFDFIVVGGGTAGAIAARRLAEDPEVRVLLIEAGPSDEGVDRILELPRWQELLGDPRYGHDFVIEPQPRGNADIVHSRGVMLGGCSSHNSCIAFEPPAYDFDRWAAAGAVGWSRVQVAPWFARVRERVSFERSDSGNALVEAFLEAAGSLGVPVRDFAEGVGEGAGWFHLNKAGTQRSSSSVAYLHPLSQLPGNLTIWTETPVLRVDIEGGRAVGVRTPTRAPRAEREVILCAGAFASPKLLMLSGIGPAEHLRSLGISPLVDLAGVGEHLQDHPEGAVVFEAAQPVPQRSYNRYEAGMFVRVDEDAPWPDLMFHFGIEAFDLHTRPNGYPTAEHAFSLTPNVTRARSEGTVRLRSSDPGADPRIDFRYFTDSEGYDERIMVEGIRIARELVRQPALAQWCARELAPGPRHASFAELSSYARTTANTVYHPAGTCRMGAADDPDAVVTPELAVRGVAGLRVADASVFPFVPSVNPAVTCMMVGERVADLAASGRPDPI